MRMSASDGIKRPTLFAPRSKLGTNLAPIPSTTLCMSLRSNFRTTPKSSSLSPNVWLLANPVLHSSCDTELATSRLL